MGWKVGTRVRSLTGGINVQPRWAPTLQHAAREIMRITKLIGIVAAMLLGVAPVGVSAQKSGAKSPAKTAIARSDVRELPADQQIIQALNRLTFGAKPGDILKVRAIGLDNWINQQLRPEKINDDAMSAFVGNYSALYSTLRGRTCVSQN